MTSSPCPTLPLTLLTLPTFSAASNSRLQSLYSDFSRQKHSNPASFHANVEWWRQTLEHFVANGLQRQSRLVLNAGHSLVNNLRVEGTGKPIGLGAVITELYSSSSNTTPPFIPLSVFISAQTSIYHSQTSVPYLVASYLVGKPLWWALEQLGIAGEDGLLSSTSSSKQSATSWHGDYVLLTLVQNAAEQIITQQQSATTPADCLYTFDDFRTAFASCMDGSQQAIMSEIDAKVLVRYLERDKGVIVVTKDTIKFVEKDASADARKITAVDVGILELKTAIHKLHSQVEGIQSRIDQCTEKASAAIKQSHKDMAMSHLRVRKQLQALLPKRLASLDNLEGTLISVEAAAGDIEILSAFQSSTTTLRTILSHPSLQRDSIERTMEAMAEANADAKQVDEAIKISGDIALGIDDADFDVEDELKGLVEQAERETALSKEKETQDRLERLPATPALPEQKKEEEARVPISA